MYNFLQDLHFAFRTLIKKPDFTVVVVLTLAIGIGANTAVFSVINGVLLKPLPYQEPERLVRLYHFFEDSPGNKTMSVISGSKFIDLRNNIDAFENLACFNIYKKTGFDYTTGDHPVKLSSLPISAGYFEVFKVKPILGRTFTFDESFSNSRLIILSYKIWQQYMEGDPGCIGQNIVLDGEPCTIIGIMPEGFHNLFAGDVDLWSPIGLNELPGWLEPRNNLFLSTVGRLKPEVTLEQAQAELDLFRVRLNEGWSARLVSLHNDLVGDTRPMLQILMAAVGLVLLIACVNIANLYLVRGFFREKEIAIRAALGSSRFRLICQFLTENLVVALLGGLTGILFAAGLVEGLSSIFHGTLPRMENVFIDWGVFLFSTALSLISVFLFGIIPTIQLSRPNLESSFREGSQRIGGSFRKRHIRNIFAITQISLAMVLLIGSGLLVKSFYILLKTDLGFKSDHVVSFEVLLPDARYNKPTQRISFYKNFFEEVESLPGVQAIGSVSKLPASGQYHTWIFEIQEYPRIGDRETQLMADFRCVDGNYFQAMNIGLHKGRLFDRRDNADAPLVAIISDSVAQEYWQGDDPIGNSIQIGEESRTIIGIVQDTRHDYREAVSKKVYLPHDQFAENRNWNMTQVVRTQADGLNLVESIRQKLTTIDPELVVYNVQTLDNFVVQGICKERLAMVLMGIFAGAALLLAAIGIYGVLSFLVNQRVHEIGIRVALGARRNNVLKVILSQGLTLTMLGVSIGLLVSLLFMRVMSGLIYGIRINDPTTYISASIILITVAFIACFIPARRAIKIDPMEALRYE